MKLKDKLTDSYLVGAVIAFLFLPFTYFIVESIRSEILIMKADPYLYPPPASQLVTLLFSIIVFRILMINLGKEKLAKGYFFILGMSVFIYFFIYHHLKR